MAALFAVGLPFTYDGTTNHFATTTGGSATVAAVTSADTVTVDANSGNGTLTIGATFSCTALTVSRATATVACDATHGITASGAVTLTIGTLDTNGQTCSWGSFSSSNANARTLTLGSSAITITAGGAAWTNATSGGLVITANTAVITLSGAASTWSHGGVNYNGASVVFSGSGACGFVTSTATTTFANVTRTGTAAKTDTFNSTGGITCTILTLNSNSDVNRLIFQSSVGGTPRTVTAGSVVITNTVDFQDITGAGTATWTVAGTGATALGDCGGNSGITFTPSATQTRTGAAGSWSTLADWTSRVPLPQDDVVISSGASGTITGDMPRLGRSVDFTGFAGTWSRTVASTVFGSLTLVPGMSLAGTVSVSFSGRAASYTVTSATKAFASGGVSFNQGTYTLLDAMTVTNGTFTFSGGTFDTGNFDISCNTFNSQSAIARTCNLGTSTISVGSTNLITINDNTLTLNASSATFLVNVASSAVRTMAFGANRTIGTITYTVAASPGALALTGGNLTVGTVNIGSGRGFTPSSNSTINVTNWNVNGVNNGYLYLPGASGNYASTPDSVATSITGDIDLRVHVAMNLWTPAAVQMLISKRTASASQFSYELRVNTTGKLEFVFSLNGTAGSAIASSVNPTVADGSDLWVRATRVAASGVITFYTSPDGITYTQLGTPTTTTTGNLFDSTAALEIGSDQVGVNNLAGKMYRAQVYNGIAGTLAFDADFTTKPFGANTFTESSANAATVTINGAAAQVGDGRVAVTSSSNGVAGTLSFATQAVSDYITVQDNTASTTIPAYAGVHGVLVSGTTNWNATAPPSGSNLMMMGV